MSKTASVIWKTLFFIGLLIVGMLIRGYVIMDMWNWFVPAALSGAHNIHLAVAIGLSILVSFFTYQSNDNDTFEKGYASAVGLLAVYYFVAYPLVLLLAWFVHLYV